MFGKDVDGKKWCGTISRLFTNLNKRINLLFCIDLVEFANLTDVGYFLYTSVFVASSIVQPASPQVCRELEKKAYESRICEVEHSIFTPLVFSATRGMGHEATIFYKRLASLLSEKWKEPYASSVLGWIRCHLSFCLFQSAIQCIRGARSSQGHYIKCGPDPIRNSILNLVL